MDARSPHLARLQPASPTLALAKRRARRRAHEGGAVVFIVSMTIGVLVALGAFALISAATEIKSAGYERQSLQTHYLSEYAMVATAQFVNGDSAAAVESYMRNHANGTCPNCIGDYDPGYPRNHCTSLETVPVTAGAKIRSCKILRMSDLSQGWSGIPAALRPSSPTIPGSLGAVPFDGDFGVEVTDTMQGAPLPGNALTQPTCPVTFTVSSVGQTKPSVAFAGANTTQIFGASSLEAGRGLVTGGPIPCVP